MADQNPDLLKQADELGIKTDKRWGDDRLQQEIDKALGEAPAKTHEDAGTAPDRDAAGHELVGRQAYVDPLDHDGDGKKGGAAPALHAMIVNRDFWDADGVRHPKGSIAEVTADAAIDGAASGALSRVR